MKRQLLSFLLTCVFSIFSVSMFAYGAVFPVNVALHNAASCPASPNHAASNFCDVDAGFQSVVYCYCHNQVPLPSCRDMQWVYNAMISRYGTLEKGCEHNPAGTDVHECMDQWSCYMTGKPADSSSAPCADAKPMCG